ncbi:hypothetical protein H4Q26_016307 [Puccinia striiformis f. sp. tritici PST-130]|nr:hypothetical protein H4Q26_016307 [Puccinia striiformis f. sp. tritici PST-130]
MSSMAAWEETKNIPNNKEIIIQEGPSASNPFSTEKAHQKPQKKGVKLNKPVKPVNLTNKDSLPEQNSLENTLHSANDLPSNILLNTSNHPQPNTANEESRTQPNLALPDQTAMPPPDVPAHSTPPAPGGSLPDTSTTASSTNNKSTTSRPVDPHVAAESQQPKPPDQPLNTSITSSLSSELPKTAKSSKIPTPQPNNQSSGSGTRAGTDVMRAAAGWRRAAREIQTGPLANELWNCPDIINFPWLPTFFNKYDTLPPQQFISTVAKTAHPESTLVQYLFRLIESPESVISN